MKKISTIWSLLLIILSVGTVFSQQQSGKSSAFNIAGNAEFNKQNSLVQNNQTVNRNSSASTFINDTICGAIELILNGPLVGENTALADLTDASDTMAAAAGFTISTPNNTLWYYYTAPATGYIEVLYGGPVGTTELWGWCGEFSATSCSGPLNYIDYFVNGSQYSGDTAIHTLHVVAGSTYYFMIDGVVGATGFYLFGLRSVTTGIDEFNLNGSSSFVYPNPAKEILNLNYHFENSNQVDYEFLDIAGRVIYSGEINSSSAGNPSIDVSKFKNGAYILRLNSKSGSLTQKVMVLH